MRFPKFGNSNPDCVGTSRGRTAVPPNPIPRSRGRIAGRCPPAESDHSAFKGRRKGRLLRSKVAGGFFVALGGGLFTAVWLAVARAHVKWFAPYDLTLAPTSPEMFVPQGAWLLGLALSILALWLAVGMDQLDRRLGLLAHVRRPLARLAVRGDDVMRITLGVWLTWLWALPSPVFLTPELASPTANIHWLQLLLAVFCVSRRTAWITGVGLLLLYGAAIGHYGLYHLADYPLFIGIGVYLVAVSARHAGAPSLRRFARHRLSILVVTMAATLCWASIEKWGYSSWTIPVLTDRPHLAMGFDFASFIALAGWVEFGLAILLVIGGRLTCRLAALALLFMFCSAVLEFGKLDLVGYLPIIASLLLVVAAGNGAVGQAAGFSGRGVAVRLAALPIVYFTSLALIATAYISGWQAAYGAAFGPGWAGGLDASLLALGGAIAVSSLLALGAVAVLKKGPWFVALARRLRALLSTVHFGMRRHGRPLAR